MRTFIWNWTGGRSPWCRATGPRQPSPARWVKKEGIEKSIQQTGSKFVFGADHFEELGNMTTGYHKIKDDNILRGMELFSPAYRLFALLPIAKKVTQKILIFEKDEQSV